MKNYFYNKVSDGFLNDYESVDANCEHIFDVESINCPFMDSKRLIEALLQKPSNCPFKHKKKEVLISQNLFLPLR